MHQFHGSALRIIDAMKQLIKDRCLQKTKQLTWRHPSKNVKHRYQVFSTNKHCILSLGIYYATNGPKHYAAHNWGKKPMLRLDLANTNLAPLVVA